MGSFIDEIQIEEYDDNGIHVLTDEELSELNTCEVDMNIIHQFNIKEIHPDYWYDFNQINEDDVPF